MYSRFLRMSARVRAMSAVRLSSSNCEATEKTCAIVDCCHSRRVVAQGALVPPAAAAAASGGAR